MLQHFEAVDKTVIEGHVIPSHVLFTAPTPNEKPYATASFNEQMQVTISFTTDHKKRKSEFAKPIKTGFQFMKPIYFIVFPPFSIYCSHCEE